MRRWWNGTKIELLNRNQTVLKTINVPNLGDNSVQKIVVDDRSIKVDGLLITLTGQAGLDQLQYLRCKVGEQKN